MPKKISTYPTNKKAFTLVEILVVIGIITILSALVITALNPAQLRKAARDTNRQKDVSIITSALEQYYADNNAYPNVSAVSGQVNQFNCLKRILQGDNDCNAANSLPSPAPAVYLKTVPNSQSLPSIVEYCYVGGGQSYVVCAPLEGQLTEITTGGLTKCTTGLPQGVLSASDHGRYCIENPF